MRGQVVLDVDNVVHGVCQHVVGGVRVVADYDVFELLQFVDHVVVVQRIVQQRDAVVVLTGGHTVDVREYHVVLMLHVAVHLGEIVVIISEYQESHVVRVLAVDGLDQLLADGGEYEVEEIRVSVLKIGGQRRQADVVRRVGTAAYQVGHGKECGGVQMLVTAYFCDGAVAEAQRDIKTVNDQ